MKELIIIVAIAISLTTLLVLAVVLKYPIFWEVVEEKKVAVIFRRLDKAYLGWRGQGFYWLFAPYAYRAGYIKTGPHMRNEKTPNVRSRDGIPFTIEWQALFNIDLRQCHSQEMLSNLTRAYMSDAHYAVAREGMEALRKIVGEEDAQTLCDGRQHEHIQNQLSQELQPPLTAMGYRIVFTKVKGLKPDKGYEEIVSAQHQRALGAQTAEKVIERIMGFMTTVPAAERAGALKLLLELEYIEKLGLNGRTNHLHTDWPEAGRSQGKNGPSDMPPDTPPSMPPGGPPYQPNGRTSHPPLNSQGHQNGPS